MVGPRTICRKPIKEISSLSSLNMIVTFLFSQRQGCEIAHNG